MSITYIIVYLKKEIIKKVKTLSLTYIKIYLKTYKIY